MLVGDHILAELIKREKLIFEEVEVYVIKVTVQVD